MLETIFHLILDYSFAIKEYNAHKAEIAEKLPAVYQYVEQIIEIETGQRSCIEEHIIDDAFDCVKHFREEKCEQDNTLTDKQKSLLKDGIKVDTQIRLQISKELLKSHNLLSQF
ncbi:MAG: hypothetical protein IJ776_00895 [Paludibacteraceae bacterium]|nr:hypothetical protein [Paludibacteraceae bacterium]